MHGRLFSVSQSKGGLGMSKFCPILLTLQAGERSIYPKLYTRGMVVVNDILFLKELIAIGDAKSVNLTIGINVTCRASFGFFFTASCGASVRRFRILSSGRTSSGKRGTPHPLGQ